MVGTRISAHRKEKVWVELPFISTFAYPLAIVFLISMYFSQARSLQLYE
jgi:hypothetical protein